jgi:hypothetical protein
MVDTAQAHEKQHSAEVTEQFAIGQLTLRVRTGPQSKLDYLAAELYVGVLSPTSLAGMGGARLAARNSGGDSEGVGEKGETRAAVAEASPRILTSAAFTSGLLLQDNTPSAIGQSVGSENQAFGDGDSQGQGDAGPSSELAQFKAVSCAVGSDIKQLSVVDLVDSISQVPVSHQGSALTFRQEAAIREVRELAQQCPEFACLDRLPDSLSGSDRQALDPIRCLSLGYFTLVVGAVQMREGEENQKQALRIPGHVMSRFVPRSDPKVGQIIVGIDPTKFTNGALAA